MASSLQGLAELRAQLFEALEQGADVGDRLLDVAPHVLRGVEHGLLGEVADANPGGGLGLPQVVVVEARHDVAAGCSFPRRWRRERRSSRRAERPA